MKGVTPAVLAPLPDPRKPKLLRRVRGVFRFGQRKAPWIEGALRLFVLRDVDPGPNSFSRPLEQRGATLDVHPR